MGGRDVKDSRRPHIQTLNKKRPWALPPGGTYTPKYPVESTLGAPEHPKGQAQQGNCQVHTRLSTASTSTAGNGLPLRQYNRKRPCPAPPPWPIVTRRCPRAGKLQYYFLKMSYFKAFYGTN